MSERDEFIRRVMGEPDSPTGKLVALRKTPGPADLETGVWYSNFTRVKDEAYRRGLPFFAMWTNGDLCGFCKRFTRNILEPMFLEKMKTSGGLWWLGGSMDDNEEDSRGGAGFTWCLGPERKVNYFPFFAVYHGGAEIPTIQFFGSGHDYDQRKTAPDGTKLIIQKIFDIFTGDELPDNVPVTELIRTGRRDAEKDAPAHGGLRIRLNPSWDAMHVARFHDALRENGGHCVCQKDRTSATLCLCESFMRQGYPGLCHCGVFEKYRI